MPRRHSSQSGMTRADDRTRATSWVSNAPRGLQATSDRTHTWDLTALSRPSLVHQYGRNKERKNKEHRSVKSGGNRPRSFQKHKYCIPLWNNLACQWWNIAQENVRMKSVVKTDQINSIWSTPMQQFTHIHKTQIHGFANDAGKAKRLVLDRGENLDLRGQSLRN